MPLAEQHRCVDEVIVRFISEIPELPSCRKCAKIRFLIISGLALGW
jgi:hypothetical protein